MTDGSSEAYEAKQWDMFCENNDLLLENDQLKAENAKLRDLVADVWHLVKPNPGCRYTAALERIEELGIEIDQ